MSTPHSETTRANLVEVLSPELVLVDPRLAVRARQQLADPGDTLTWLGNAKGGSSLSFDEAADTAARRLARASLAAPDAELAPERQGTLRRFMTVAAALFATFSLALLVVADLALEAEETPATAETSELAEPPAIAKVGKVPELGSRSDQAQQRRASVNPGPDTASLPNRSGTPRALAPRRLAWAPVDRASGYHVELFRGTPRVFAADTTRPVITIPAKWTFDRREHQLEAVAYRWYVWPIVSGRRATKAVVQARLVVRDR